MKSCPHCGSEEYYVITHFSGSGVYYRRFDGDEGYNSAMYDPVNIKEGKTAYCANCEKKLGSVDKIIKQGEIT